MEGVRAGLEFALKARRLARYGPGMLSHVVIFWFRKGTSPEAVAAFRDCAISNLTRIPGVLHLNCGAPIPSERDVVDRSYSVALSMMFASRTELDTYQVHPVHVEFVKKCVRPHVERLVVYDFD